MLVFNQKVHRSQYFSHLHYVTFKTFNTFKGTMSNTNDDIYYKWLMKVITDRICLDCWSKSDQGDQRETEMPNTQVMDVL